MKKSNSVPLKDQFAALEIRMKALCDAGITGAELQKVRDDVAVLIFANQKQLLIGAGEKIPVDFTQEDREDLMQDLIVIFYEKYDVSCGELYPFVKERLKYAAIDRWRKERRELPEKDRRENQPVYQRRNISIENFTRTFDDSGEDSEYILPDKKTDQEKDMSAQLMSEEVFLNLSALVTRFFDERDRRSGTQEGFRYYKAAFTKSIFDFVKAEGMMEPPVFQHEADVLEAADLQFANFVTLYHPYSDKNLPEIRKIFFNELEKNGSVVPQYVKNENPNDIIAIPMKPFVMGGYMERVHHMKVSASLVSQQMNRYKDDAAEVLFQIGIDSEKHRKKKTKEST